jgi:hypothetical protein
MLNKTVLLVLGALVLGILPSGVLMPEGPAAASECSQSSRTSGECLSISTEVGSGSVLIGATETSAGSGGSTSGGTTSGSSSGSTSGASSTAPRLPFSPAPPRSPVLGTAECSVIVAGRCRAGSPNRNPPVTPQQRPAVPRVVIPPTPPSSISDLAHFSPAPASFVIEPGSWTLPRLATNMYSHARQHEVPGQLLGWPLEVRFTPQSFRWTYGDGSSATSGGGGSSWGGAQFSVTQTSHVYRQPGVYSVGLSIDYTVSYRFVGGNFVSLPGTVSQSGGVQQLTVLRVTPVLVNQGCEVTTLRDGRC